MRTQTMTTREEIADEDIHDDDGSSSYQVKSLCKLLFYSEVKRLTRVFPIDRPLSPLGMYVKTVLNFKFESGGYRQSYQGCPRRGNNLVAPAKPGYSGCGRHKYQVDTMTQHNYFEYNFII
jgi:hypothetical protein